MVSLLSLDTLFSFLLVLESAVLGEPAIYLNMLIDVEYVLMGVRIVTFFVVFSPARLTGHTRGYSRL